MSHNRSFRVFKFVAVAAVVLLAVFVAAPSALGQCAMCRGSLAGSNNAAFIKNLNIGVLVLLVPPAAIFCSIFVLLKRRPHKGNRDDA